jgi:hypothetical protein
VRARPRIRRAPASCCAGGEIAARETVDALRAGYGSGSANETAVLNLFLSFGEEHRPPDPPR